MLQLGTHFYNDNVGVYPYASAKEDSLRDCLETASVFVSGIRLRACGSVFGLQVIGSCGSGKSTQCRLFSELFGTVHVDIRELLLQRVSWQDVGRESEVNDKTKTVELR